MRRELPGRAIKNTNSKTGKVMVLTHGEMFNGKMLRMNTLLYG